MTFLQNGPERTRPSACREHAFTRARRTNQSLSISLSIASGGTSWTGPQGTRGVGAQAVFGAALPGSVATTPLLGWLILGVKGSSVRIRPSRRRERPDQGERGQGVCVCRWRFESPRLPPENPERGSGSSSLCAGYAQVCGVGDPLRY